jgi:MFS family permease
VIIAYLVVVAGTLLTIGRLSDMIGRRLIWVAGLVIFTLGSTLCGAAPSLAMLIASRALQGLGGSLIMAISPALLTSAFLPTERGRALGLNAVVVALGTSTGPTLGGIITTYVSWRWIFYFLSANLSLILSFLALTAVSFLLPFYLEELRGFSTASAGLLLTPLPLTIALLAPISGALADRIGTRALAASGLTIACLGLVLISQLTAQSSLFDIVWRLVVTGVGQAMFQSPNNSALMGDAPREHQGSAAGFLATGRVIGQSVSVALAGAMFTSLGGAAAGAALMTGHLLSPAQVSSLQHAFSSSFHVTFIVCAAIAAVGIFASLVRGKEQRNLVPKPQTAQSRGIHGTLE